MSELPTYEIRRSKRARSARVLVDPISGAVEVVLPQRAAERVAAAAVSELRSWIDARVLEAGARRAAVAARGDTVPYLGETLTLISEPGRTRVHRVGDDLLVPADEPQPALERYYRRMARTEVLGRLDPVLSALGAEYSALRIAGQRTRWGSCSARGVLSFNWRLLLAPESVFQYVIWHEACHLQVLDHSPRFWQL
ncbi:MAG TPA: YgjP-like metallopeptidase domain-containing protein, partial [Baekduia sp.]|nr:YgjP-like metallopeptidase domain-containing protein [Baekduia sp.]